MAVLFLFFITSCLKSWADPEFSSWGPSKLSVKYAILFFKSMFTKISFWKRGGGAENAPLDPSRWMNFKRIMLW